MGFRGFAFFADLGSSGRKGLRVRVWGVRFEAVLQAWGLRGLGLGFRVPGIKGSWFKAAVDP